MLPDLKLFNLALGFYTRLPVSQNQDYSRLPEASLYLPLVGWLVGGLSGLCFYLTDLIWAQPTSVILTLAFGILLTGAFHEDGFADVCDGFGGGYSKGRILEIMKDSRIGVYGALGLVLLLALKISLLVALPATSVPAVLIAGHSLSRFQPLLIMRRYGYARSENSKGGATTFKPERRGLMLAGIISLLPLVLLPTICLLAVPIMMTANWRLGRYFHRHIGGYTGDCLGAAQQTGEVVFYLAVSALWIYS